MCKCVLAVLDPDLRTTHLTAPLHTGVAESSQSHTWKTLSFCSSSLPTAMMDWQNEGGGVRQGRK